MTSRRYFFGFALVLVIVGLALAGCRGATNSTVSNAASSPDVFKVAMLFPTPIDDGGWSQAGYQGLKLIEEELGAQIAYTSSVPEDEIEEIFRQYASEGYDFIVGQGGEYIEGAEIIAEEFPRTKFAVVAGYGGNNKNIGALSFRDGEVGYLTGVVAALKTDTDKVAFIGGQPYAHMMEQALLFERGAKASNPSIETSIEWVESWSDQDKAREIAQAHVEAGTDVLVVDADIAGLAVFDVAEEAGIYVVGWSLDQHHLAPDAMITSAIQRVPVLLLEGATLVQQGRWEGKQYKFGLQAGAQDLAPFYGMLTPEEEAQVNAIKEEIIAGQIDVTP